ncbi:MAG: hypothetical protein JXA23_07665 [Bacteroidales bacterium]|nr:hypothetical protein [Bacteroidales bacterium]
MELKENPIFRNIQFQPRIWGLSYVHLFGSLGGVFVSLMFFKSFGILVGLVIAVILGGVAYCYFYWVDNIQDKANQHLKNTIKTKIVSYEPSNWDVRIK